MQYARAHLAAPPHRFGRGPMRNGAAVGPAASWALGDDLKLFAMTFVAGFVFVSILIG